MSKRILKEHYLRRPTLLSSVLGCVAWFIFADFLAESTPLWIKFVACLCIFHGVHQAYGRKRISVIIPKEEQ